MTNHYLPAFLLILAASTLHAQNNNGFVKIFGQEVLCAGQCDTLRPVVDNAQGTFPPPYTYFWTGPGNFAVTVQNVVICPSLSGAYTLTVTNVEGITASATHAVYVAPFQPLYLYSNNFLPCNLDSSGAFCEKVCPHTTVTYQVQAQVPGGSAGNSLVWQVTGASSYQVNSPPSTSVTVTWGAAGSGSVSVSIDPSSGPITGACGGEDALCVTIIEAPHAQFSSDPAPNVDSLTVCKGQTVYFDNQSTAADFYQWAFGDDLSTTFEAEPQHVFQTPGQYVVRLIAQSSCLCADTTLLHVEVLDAVSPTLDCVGTVCPNETVTYTADNGCAPYAWSVTSNGIVLNGGTAGSDSITVQWLSGPAGTITLGTQTCTGALCPQPAVIHIPVISDAAEIQGNERVCGASQEGYSIEPYGGTNFVWSLSGGGGSIFSGYGTNHVTVNWTAYPDPNQTYWLSVKYDNCYLGCGGQDSIAVRILSPFIIDGPVEACASTSTAFHAKLTTPGVNLVANWMLHGPDGSTVWTSAMASANVNVPFVSTDGLYQLIAVPADPTQTCSDQATWAINVAPLPDPPTAISGPAIICPGNSYTYEAVGITANSNLQWTVQNGPAAPVIYTGNPLNITWATSGPYGLAVRQVGTNGLGCLSDSTRLEVVALNLPIIVGDNVVCEDATAQYTIANLQDIDIQWMTTPTEAGAIANGQGSTEVEIFWTQVGNQLLSANVCGQIVTFPVNVLAQPSPMVQAPTSVCVGQTKPVQTSGSYSTYLWRDKNGATLATSPTTNLGAGSYSVQVTDAQGCAGTSEFTIDVAPDPNLNITTADFTGFCLNSNFVTISALVNADGDFQYQWFQNGAPVGGNTPTYTTNQYGLYTAMVTNQYGCTASDGPVTITNDCGGGGGIPGPMAPNCPSGSIDLAIMPTASCDSFNFQVSGVQYQPGSATWYFGESGAALLGTSNLNNPSFHFQNAGQYLIIVYGQLQNGATCRVIDSVKVAASAQFGVAPACPGMVTPFQDVSTFLPGSSIGTWTWDFGDPASGANNTSNVRNPAHAYAASGNYPVTLTVSANSGCTSTVTQTVVVPTVSSPTFAPPAQNCAGNALAFHAAVGPEVTNVRWNFGQPPTGPANDASGSPVYHSFTPAGNYSVMATATNAFGCTAVFSQTVTVAPNALSGNINPANPAPICEGSTVTLTAPAGGVAWLWSDSSTTTPTLTTDETGTYRVTITDASGCTYTPPPVEVEVKPAPDVLIKALLENELGQVIGTAYPTLAVCAGEDVHLEAQGSGGNYTYLWPGGNGTDDEVFFTESRNNLLAVGTHVYTVTVTDPASGCTAVTDPFVVTINPVPSGFYISSNGNCAQAATVLTYQGPLPGNWQFVWNNGQMGTTLPAAAPGVYFIRVINEFGCEAQSDPLYIQPGPPVNVIPGGCHTRCRPDTLCLPTDLPYIAAWQWYYNGDPISGATGPNLIATQSGSYWAVLTDGYGCVGQSDPLTLQLFDAYGNVTGHVWADVNNNDLIDAADTLLSGIAVDLYQNGSPVAYGKSNDQGIYAFANILAANYIVQIDAASLPPRWQVVIGQQSANMSGCRTLATADLLLKFVCPTLTSQVALQVCPGHSALYQGATLPIGASQAFPFTTAQGCDSTVTVIVQALPTSTSALTLFACVGNALIYNGMQLTPGTVQDFVFQNYLGCDSTVTVMAQTAPVSTSVLTLTACPGTTAAYNGGQLLPGTVQNFVFQNYLGCDSTVAVTVQALQNAASLLEVFVCPGAAFDYAGASMLAGETREFHLLTTGGCDSVVTVVVTTFPASTFALLSTPSCATQPTGSLLANQADGGLPPYQFSLNGGPAQTDSVFQTLAAGAYEVVLEDGNGCAASQSTTIGELPRLELALADATLPCDSNGLLLTPLVGGNLANLQYKWWNSSTSSSTLAREAGPVWIEVTNHCETLRREATVRWADLAADISYVYLPNVFAPDAETKENTVFRPAFASGLTLLDYHLEIFDRWGNLLFQSTQAEAGWEGEFRRRTMVPGVYVWHLEAEVDFCGRTIAVRKQGDVTIVR